MSFPTAAILDDFVRADENPLSDGGNWTSSPLKQGATTLKLVSNQGAPQAGGTGGSDSIWVGNGTITRPFEAYATFPQAGTNCGIDYCIADVNTTVYDLYRWQAYSASELRLYKCVNGTFSLVAGTTYTVSIADGDALGVLLDADGLHSLYHKPAAGSWTLKGTVTETTLTSGYIGVFLGQAYLDLRVEDFGGGTPLTNQILRPDADILTTGWSTPPLYSKLNDGSDSTYISATAS